MSHECRLAAELLLDRFGVVVSAAASTFSTSPFAGRPSTTLFGSSTLDDDDDGTASDYLTTPTTTTSRLFSSSAASSMGGPSHADRLADFRRSLTAAAHARGISEEEVLRQLEEEEGPDPLQSPEVEFDRMLPPTTMGRKRKRREGARDVTGVDEEEDQKPDFASSSSASFTTRSLPGWKPPRADHRDAAPPSSQATRTKKEQLSSSSPRLPPGDPHNSDDDDDDDDELMRALDAVIAEGRSPRRKFRPPPAGYLASQPASDQPREAQRFGQEEELAGRRDDRDRVASLI